MAKRAGVSRSYRPVGLTASEAVEGKREAERHAAGVRALQEWAREFDTLRGWDAVTPTDTGVHLMEEVGEVARELLRLTGYKPHGSQRTPVLRELGAELADILFLCCKLANQYGIDLSDSVAGKIAVNERRFPPGAGVAEMKRYLAAKKREWNRLRSTRNRSQHLTF